MPPRIPATDLNGVLSSMTKEEQAEANKAEKAMNDKQKKAKMQSMINWIKTLPQANHRHVDQKQPAHYIETECHL